MNKPNNGGPAFPCEWESEERMNRHFQAYNALPCAPLGEPKGAEKQQASDGEWKPLRPGYESRTLAGGATEVRSAPGYRPDVAPSVQREPAYQPEGFDFAYVDRKGHQSEAIPKRPEPAALAAPEPKQAPAAADVPEGATHRARTGLFYRVNGAILECWSNDGLGWGRSIGGVGILADSDTFERLPQPAAPEPQQ